MGRSSAAHEPSMEEILASIRKIIEGSEERGGTPGYGKLRGDRTLPAEQPERFEFEAGAEPDARLRPGADKPSRPETAWIAPFPLRAPEPERCGPQPLSRAEPADDPVAEEADEPHRAQADPSNALAREDAPQRGGAEAIDFLDVDFFDLKAELESELSSDDFFDRAEKGEAAADGGSSPSSADTFDGELRLGAGTEGWSDRGGSPTDASLQAQGLSAPDAPAAAPQAAGEAPQHAAGIFVPANNDDRRMSEFRSAVIDDSVAGSTAGHGVPLISSHTGDLVGASFEELTRAIREGELRSMDQMAEDLMRPMLQEWLDDNLPKLVERLVREEIERVARGGR